MHDVQREQPRRRRRVLNSAIFSPVGLQLFPYLAPRLARLYNIILNNDLTHRINGEAWLVSQLQNPRVVVDVGFHRGEWTDECVTRFPGARVYAFDPWPSARAYFEQAADLRRNVEFFDIALSNTQGRSRFYDYDNACNSLARRDLEAIDLVGSYEVDVTTLDSWCALHDVAQIDFLKIDAEGYDLPVLEGAHQLLKAQAIDAFCFEYADGWIESKRFLGEADRYIKDVGYTLFKLFPGFLAPFTYTLAHETFAGAMFVGLSPTAVARQAFPIRRVVGV
jgi:FkbM family methyltransferase